MRTPEEIREYKREWVRKNRAHVNELAAKYRERNRERLTEYHREYSRKWAQNNRERYRELRREWMRKFDRENPGELRRRTNEWLANPGNREAWRAYKRAYYAKRKNEPLWILPQMLRSRLTAALRGRARYVSAVRDLGCSIDELKVWLEAKFRDGMTWENYGPFWHVDHIRPVASFDLSEEAQQLAAFHYTNLQPLLAKENMTKGAR